MILSVVIPAHNGQDFLKKCIHSLLSQDLDSTQYEIIVVNDGSTDQTVATVESISKEFSNVRLFTQENRGEGGARNTGLKIAQGEYILFVDHDDYVIPGSLHQLLSIAKNKNLDILMADFYNQNKDEKPVKNHKYIHNSSEIMSGREFMEKNSISWNPWVYLFRKDFLKENSILFKENMGFVDTEFCLKNLFFAKKVSYTPIFFYTWVWHSNSMSHGRWSEKKIADAMNGLIGISSFAQYIKEDGDSSHSIFQKHINAKCYGLIKNSTAVSYIATKEVCRFIRSDFIEANKLNATNVHFKVMINLIRLNISVGALVIFITGNVLRILK